MILFKIKIPFVSIKAIAEQRWEVLTMVINFAFLANVVRSFRNFSSCLQTKIY